MKTKHCKVLFCIYALALGAFFVSLPSAYSGRPFLELMATWALIVLLLSCIASVMWLGAWLWRNSFGGE